ncbi:deoxyribodipyrimidine photo-lyase [Pedobacter westerhofensis]|uniref:Deoxyribodipyrimidine photo-lyase n=1 Tax=Pedobacter westerhofensis TaxID=425512 RepID=A0A521BZ67_9SPHI|nr:deoxyribodipyrimidine photo-lyase [Pedobacter westerhofensis]SMO52474.1 deoxyribodipyrimidine photo-lyase [Pedobacter westerhofensis]
MNKEINICWLRRDLRLNDNAALYHALKGEFPVLLLFIFDKNILDDLHDKKDARVTFIYQQLQEIENKLQKKGSSLLIKHGTPEQAWSSLLKEYTVKNVYTNHDYEPYAAERDDSLAEFLRSEDIALHTYKDQVIFEKDEVVKADGKPYTVFTPYFRQWMLKLNGFYLKAYPVEKYLKNLFQTDPLAFPSLSSLGFEKSDQEFPSADFERKLAEYEERRDYPGDDATTRIGLHLRFGTVSIRDAASTAQDAKANKWLSELAWRDFYMMILWHFPQVATKSFKPAYDNIRWRNDEKEFEAWKNGKTGYPIVDAGMNQLNQIGYMHNRVRMIVGSFLTKHLLIDWRWGEAYFAEKLLDYEMASNVGGWQWACGCGNDAAPYFRVFNPELQAKKFDPKNKYIYHWAPEYKTEKHVQPIVEHAFARERILKVFKEALAG